MKRYSVLLVFCVAFSYTFDLVAAAKKAITPEDIVNLRVVKDVHISPDGTRVAFSAGKRADFDQLRESKIWIAPVDGSEPPRLLHENQMDQSMARWSSDGRWIAFLSHESASAAPKQIWIFRFETGEAKAFTSVKSGVDSFQWAPDGKSIAFTSTDAVSDEEEQKAKQKDDVIHVDRNHKLSRLWRLDLDDRSVRKILNHDVNVNDFDWSPDGLKIAVKVSKTPLLDDVYWRSSLWIIDPQTGDVVRELDDRTGWLNIRWSPDGNRIALSKVSPSGVAEWRMLVPVDGSPAKQIDDQYAGTIYSMRWLPGGSHLLAMSMEGTRAKFVKVNAQTSQIEPQSDFFAPYADFTISADGRTVAFVAEQADSPANVWIWTAGESLRRLTNFQPEVPNWSTGELREITWRNPKDNALIYGVLVTPPGFQQNHPYPTVVQVHGGPEWAWWSGWHGSWHEWAQLLASNGYVVLLPNPRGSDGQNWRFIDANIEDWGGMDYEDILAGVDHLISQKIADPNRLGIGGWSYGGFMSAWAITHTDRFRAAIVGAAVTNLFSMSGTGDIPTFLNNYFKGTPFERRSIYDAHSPMSFLQNCKTPALIVHGDADVRVPISQGYEFYNGLKMLSRPAEMVVYPREPHGFKEHIHQKDLLMRVLDWYDRHLKEK